MRRTISILILACTAFAAFSGPAHATSVQMPFEYCPTGSTGKTLSGPATPGYCPRGMTTTAAASSYCPREVTTSTGANGYCPQGATILQSVQWPY